MVTKRFLASISLAGAAALLISGCASGSGDGGGGGEVSGGDDANSAPLYEQLPDWVKEKGKLTFVGDSHPPYRTVGTDGKITGMDPELLDLISAQLGVEIEMEVASGMDSMLTGMLSGRYDGFNGPVRATPEREVDFDAIAYMSTRTAYIYLSENSGAFKDSGDVCGTVVAGVQGSVTETEVEALNKWCTAEGRDTAEFLGLADTNATILAVQSGRAESLALTEPGALDLMRETPDTFGYVTQSDEQGSPESLLAMLAPKSNELGPVLLDAMQNLFDDGSYAEYMEKWQVSNIALDAPLLNPTSTK